MKGQELLECGGLRLVYWRRERTSGIADISSYSLWHHRTSWANVSLVNDFIGKRSALDMVPTVTVVDLLHYSPDFVGFEAPQV